jgi:hypothetical protein
MITILPSKPLTLDLMKTLDLFFRKACYHQNASYKKIKRIKVVEKLWINKFGCVDFWYMIHLKKLRNLQKKAQS